MDEPNDLPLDSTPADLGVDPSRVVDLSGESTPCVIKSGVIVKISRNGSAKFPDGRVIKSLKDCKFEPESGFAFEYSDYQKPPVKKQSLPDELTPTIPTKQQVSTTVLVPAPIRASDENIPRKIESDSSVSLTGLILATAATVAVTTVAIKSINSRRVKKKTSAKVNNINQQNQKKKEEQKKCNSKSELVQMKIDQTNAMIERIEDSLNKLDKPEQNGVDFDLGSFKKEIGSLKKKIKKLEERNK